MEIYEDLPTSHIAWEPQAWRDNPEGGLQGYREKLGLEARPASLPQCRGIALCLPIRTLWYHYPVTLASALVYYRY